MDFGDDFVVGCFFDGGEVDVMEEGFWVVFVGFVDYVDVVDVVVVCFVDEVFDGEVVDVVILVVCVDVDVL